MSDGDENSKSLVLITRVGSTPTTGIEKRVRKQRFLARLFLLEAKLLRRAFGYVKRTSHQECFPTEESHFIERQEIRAAWKQHIGSVKLNDAALKK